MIVLRRMLKSSFVDFAAVGDYVNGELALRRIDGIEDAPMTHAQFVPRTADSRSNPPSFAG